MLTNPFIHKAMPPKATASKSKPSSSTSSSSPSADKQLAQFQLLYSILLEVGPPSVPGCWARIVVRLPPGADGRAVTVSGASRRYHNLIKMWDEAEIFGDNHVEEVEEANAALEKRSEAGGRPVKAMRKKAGSNASSKVSGKGKGKGKSVASSVGGDEDGDVDMDDAGEFGESDDEVDTPTTAHFTLFSTPPRRKSTKKAPVKKEGREKDEEEEDDGPIIQVPATPKKTPARPKAKAKTTKGKKLAVGDEEMEMGDLGDVTVTATPTKKRTQAKAKPQLKTKGKAKMNAKSSRMVEISQGESEEQGEDDEDDEDDDDDDDEVIPQTPCKKKPPPRAKTKTPAKAKAKTPTKKEKDKASDAAKPEISDGGTSPPPSKPTTKSKSKSKPPTNIWTRLGSSSPGGLKPEHKKCKLSAKPVVRLPGEMLVAVEDSDLGLEGEVIGRDEEGGEIDVRYGVDVVRDGDVMGEKEGNMLCGRKRSLGEAGLDGGDADIDAGVNVEYEQVQSVVYFR